MEITEQRNDNYFVSNTYSYFPILLIIQIYKSEEIILSLSVDNVILKS